MASLFAGNGVVIKCSEQVVWSTSWFIGVIRECLAVCGFDPELVQVCSSIDFSQPILINIFPPACVLLARRSKCPDYFTVDQTYHLHRVGRGWTKSASPSGIATLRSNLHQVAEAATTHLTPITLELGGKDPAVILPGTNLEKWSSLWMRGIL